jgi:hypothetical protein
VPCATDPSSLLEFHLHLGPRALFAAACVAFALPSRQGSGLPVDGADIGTSDGVEKAPADVQFGEFRPTKPGLRECKHKELIVSPSFFQLGLRVSCLDFESTHKLPGRRNPRCGSQCSKNLVGISHCIAVLLAEKWEKPCSQVRGCVNARKPVAAASRSSGRTKQAPLALPPSVLHCLHTSCFVFQLFTLFAPLLACHP